VRPPVLLLGAAAAIEDVTELGASMFLSSCAQPARDGVAVLALLDAATQRGTASILFAEAA
jgi:hypothetical protein